jgi:hypothetical protein
MPEGHGCKGKHAGGHGCKGKHAGGQACRRASMPEGMVARASMPESTPLRVRFGAVDLLVRGALVAGCLARVSARAGWADRSAVPWIY